MRTYTIGFSIFAHAMVVGALIIAPALATDDLPEPRRTTAFIVVRPEFPPLRAPIRAPRVADPSAPGRPVPVTPPPDLQPEAPVEPAPEPGFDVPTTLAGIPAGEGVPGGDLIPPPPPAPPRQKDPVRVGGRIEAPVRLVFVEPIYPPMAIAARREGLVILEALISEDGAVREVRVLRPEPLFDQAAIAAVRQWRFSPTLLNGERVPIVMTVTIGFRLTK